MKQQEEAIKRKEEEIEFEWSGLRVYVKLTRWVYSTNPKQLWSGSKPGFTKVVSPIRPRQKWKGSGDTAPCRMAGHPTRGCIPRNRSSYTGLYLQKEGYGGARPRGTVPSPLLERFSFSGAGCSPQDPTVGNVSGFVFRVPGLGSGCRASGSRFWVPGFGFQVSGSIFRVPASESLGSNFRWRA